MTDITRTPLLVRPAAEADIPAITRIYNEGIADKCTLETELRTADERRQWLSGPGERHPVTLTTFPHLPAVGLYVKLGFRHVGDYEEQGMLDGGWVDTRIMEYIFQPAS